MRSESAELAGLAELAELAQLVQLAESDPAGGRKPKRLPGVAPETRVTGAPNSESGDDWVGRLLFSVQ